MVAFLQPFWALQSTELESIALHLANYGTRYDVVQTVTYTSCAFWNVLASVATLSNLVAELGYIQQPFMVKYRNSIHVTQYIYLSQTTLPCNIHSYYRCYI